MTRWKFEARTTLVLLHAHHSMSRWYDYLFRAAEQLGLLVGYSVSANHSDGSTDREWYVNSAQLESVGGLAAVRRLANDNRDRDETNIEYWFD